MEVARQDRARQDMKITRSSTNQPDGVKPADGDEPELWSRFLGPIFDLKRGVVYALVIAQVVVIALLDLYIERNISMGVLYIFPVIFGAMAFNRYEMLILVAICSVLREHAAPFAWEPDVQHRLFYTAISYAGVGLLLGEVARSRRLGMKHFHALHEQIERRRAAEAQLTALVESSPAAIVTLDKDGIIELANSAAEQILAVPHESLPGRNIFDFVPVVADLARQNATGMVYRATTSGIGHRASGESFQAYVWFSTLPSPDGNRLAAIIVDGSEDLRDWQEASLQSILQSTRVLVGSVAHEIRNLAAAIVMVHANLGRIAGVTESEDYRALGTLAQGLARLASSELAPAPNADLRGISLLNLVEEFGIIVAPSLEAIDGVLIKEVPPEAPLVLADHQGLIQVLMNLSRNSVRVMAERPQRRLTLRLSFDPEYAYLRVRDTGPGLEKPELAFQPFQPFANASGLGLFVSRAIVRACQGELYHEPTQSGCSMVIKLKVYQLEESTAEMNEIEVER
jgi:PAS domain S-box-containing protein